MRWLWIAAGFLLLSAAGMIHFFFKRNHHADSSAASGSGNRYARIRLSRQIFRLIQKCCRLPADSPDVEMLHRYARLVLEHLLRTRRLLRSTPSLPAASDHEPRLMDLARTLLDDGCLALRHCCDALASWEHVPASTTEINALPLCLSVAQSQRLAVILRTLLTDAKARANGKYWAQRLARCKNPESQLDKMPCHPTGMAALLSTLQEHDQHQLMALATQRLSTSGQSAQSLSQSVMQHEIRLADELRRSVDCFSAIDHMNWSSLSAEADEAHRLLLLDPGGIYPQMTPFSQLDLRIDIEKLSRAVKLSTSDVIQCAVSLCDEAEDRSLGKYVGYWFQDPKGLRALHRSLPSRRGRLYIASVASKEWHLYATLCSFGFVSGFVFLQAHQPVFMLPFFLLTAGALLRRIIKPPRQSLPGMKISVLQKECRTLVVLPAVLPDSHVAISMVRRLKILLTAMSEENVDFMLLGDYAPAVTAVSSSDAEVIQAALQAVTSLNTTDHVMYLQRSRIWDSRHHRYCPRGSRQGAVTEICRLITQGECEDPLAFSTIEPAQLERRYAYVLVLPGDRQPAPGMLQELLQTMTHPLCSRIVSTDGKRGFSVLSPAESAVFDGIGLIRPDTYLEATDGLIPDWLDADVLCGELAGYAVVPDAHIQPAAGDSSWGAQYVQTLHGWRHVPWQFPWVHTPSGLVNNPLSFLSRFRLREQLRRTLVPLGQAGLLLWGVLIQSWFLVLFVLASCILEHVPRRWQDALQFICRFSLLPTRTAVMLCATVDALRRKSRQSISWISLEVWAQGLAAAIFLALGIALPGFALPALLFSALFASFPLTHRCLDAPLASAKGLSEEHMTLLKHVSASTWQFFRQQLFASDAALPSSAMQFEPALGSAKETSPEAIAGGLFASICAKDLSLLSADAAAERIRLLAEGLEALPMPYGLPCRRYSLSNMAILDARVETHATGFFAAALMTAAQALRTWLPELSPEHHGLSSRLSHLISHLELPSLYDAAASRFYQALDANGQGVGYVDFFADEALLLSVVACARKIAPPEHLRQLSRTCIAVPEGNILLSEHGTASAHLLPGIFFPMNPEGIMPFIHRLQHYGEKGLWGQDACACFSFDPQLQYRRQIFGLSEAAVDSPSTLPVYAPFAAALALAYAPREAGEALLRFKEFGALSANGFLEAVDLSHGTALVHCYDTWHQALLLMATAHVLADAPIQRYFCAIPEVEACLPLLEETCPPLILPRLSRPSKVPNASFSAARPAASLTLPADAHIMGTGDFHVIADGNGCSSAYDGAIPLTRSARREEELYGIQFYLADESRLYRLGNQLLPGGATFAPGEVQYDHTCGSLKVSMACTADTVHKRMLHMITITNMATIDRLIELTDVLLPDLQAEAGTLEASHPQRNLLSLHSIEKDFTLYHTFASSISPLSVSVCTQEDAFLGRDRSLHTPSSLEEAPTDLAVNSSAPCLSFRLKFSLSGRGQISVWYSTSMKDTPLPTQLELSGIRRLAVLQDQAIRETARMTSQQAMTASRLTAPFLASGGSIVFLQDSPPPMHVLFDLLTIADFFVLHGLSLDLCIACPAELASAVQDTLRGRPAEAHTQITDAAAFHFAERALVLRSSIPLQDQMDSLYTAVELSRPLLINQPQPAALPDKKLLQPCLYGGFDPETNDFIIQLEPGETTPTPWINRHMTRHLRETVDESGFRSPFHEQVWLCTEDDKMFSPWSTALPRSVRYGVCQTQWEAWSDTLDVRLSAACLTAHACGLRVLRLMNTSGEETQLRVHVLATLGQYHTPLECFSGIVMTEKAVTHRYAFIAGDGWESRRTHGLAAERISGFPCPDMPDTQDGRTALLTCTLTLPPKGSVKVSWIAGYARHAEDVASALQLIRQQGSSWFLRAAQTAWSDCLNALSISTPEDTLTLMVNRMLPAQFMPLEAPHTIHAMALLRPQTARRRLLQAARHAASRDEWAEIALAASAFIRITQDEAVLHVHPPHLESTLYERCTEVLLSLPADKHGLPLGPDPARQCFVYALAAHALDQLYPMPALAEMHRKLLHAADVHLWQDGSFGTPLRLDIQHLAFQAYGLNPRTKQALQTCWAVLYDQQNGLIRLTEAIDASTLPGFPQNGGMNTREAVGFLRALLQAGLRDEAFELLRALNPLHHTDDPVRMEIFREAPYLLHGGMQAHPLQPGQATVEGGEAAASLLYTVVLEDVLGFQRKGNQIHLTPCVPPEWDDFALTLHEGASTWHISLERRITQLTIDGEESKNDVLIVRDDGKIHQVRFPLR